MDDKTAVLAEHQSDSRVNRWNLNEFRFATEFSYTHKQFCAINTLIV